MVSITNRDFSLALQRFPDFSPAPLWQPRDHEGHRQGSGDLLQDTLRAHPDLTVKWHRFLRKKKWLAGKKKKPPNSLEVCSSRSRIWFRKSIFGISKTSQLFPTLQIQGAEIGFKGVSPIYPPPRVASFTQDGATLNILCPMTIFWIWCISLPPSPQHLQWCLKLQICNLAMMVGTWQNPNIGRRNMLQCIHALSIAKC